MNLSLYIDKDLLYLTHEIHDEEYKYPSCGSEAIYIIEMHFTSL